MLVEPRPARRPSRGEVMPSDRRSQEPTHDDRSQTSCNHERDRNTPTTPTASDADSLPPVEAHPPHRCYLLPCCVAGNRSPAQIQGVGSTIHAHSPLRQKTKKHATRPTAHWAGPPRVPHPDGTQGPADQAVPDGWKEHRCLCNNSPDVRLLARPLWETIE